jgi:hypothetical protein
MTASTWFAMAAVLGAMSLCGLTFVGGLALALSLLDRRRYVRRLHRMRGG